MRSISSPPPQKKAPTVRTSSNFLVIDYFYQQMHQDKFVTVFFIKRVPQYAFRQLYWHNQGAFLK
jgi:hypothetical protein